MKSCGYVVVFLVLTGSIFASDVSAPPAKKTVEWTATAAASSVIPFVDFSKGVPLEEALAFIKGMQPGPEESHPGLQSRFGKRFDQSTLVHVKQKGITMLRAVSMVADELGAQIIIEPGVIIIAEDLESSMKIGISFLILI